MDYYWAIERNAFELVLRRWKNLHYAESSKSERETQISYTNAYMEYRKMVYDICVSLSDLLDSA